MLNGILKEGEIFTIDETTNTEGIAIANILANDKEQIIYNCHSFR